ncbi:hypothetical protein [Teredinibacter haidensis]|uniref:hypothetical protein n=1 Tax=Teredinibacter haidensis TaxID=2731755 RepID=UPI000948907E|nr:hypothetical protein [Teredinibacter haidensis]
MIYKFIIVGLIVLSLTACVSPTANISKSYSLDSNSQNGLLVGSVKYRGLLSGYRIYFRGIDNEQSGYFEAGVGIMLIPIPPSSDFKYTKGNLQVAELPAGKYEISRWGVKSGYVSLSQTQPFAINFEIKPGKATYIGSFIFTVTSSIGLTVTGVKVDFEEKYSQDIAVLREKYPNLGSTEIFMGLEPEFTKNDVGGTSSARWEMPPVFIPVGG